MEHGIVRDEPIYRFWLSRHQWNLMQHGVIPLWLEKRLAHGQRVVVELIADEAGHPAVHGATLQQRRRFRGYRTVGVLPRECVTIHIEES
jgi:hypothetical protein